MLRHLLLHQGGMNGSACKMADEQRGKVVYLQGPKQNRPGEVEV